MLMSFSNLAGEPPSVDYCPPMQKHHIDSHHDSVQVFWVEPKFDDNVKVTEVTRTNVRRACQIVEFKIFFSELIFN